VDRTAGRLIGTVTALVAGPTLTAAALYGFNLLVVACYHGTLPGPTAGILLTFTQVAGSLCLGAYLGASLGDFVGRSLCGYPPKESPKRPAGNVLGACVLGAGAGGILLLVGGITSFPHIRGWRIAALLASPTVALLVARSQLRAPDRPPATIVRNPDSRTRVW
jgi:hypothetical protein